MYADRIGGTRHFQHDTAYPAVPRRTPSQEGGFDGMANPRDHVDAGQTRPGRSSKR